MYDVRRGSSCIAALASRIVRNFREYFLSGVVIKYLDLTLARSRLQRCARCMALWIELLFGGMHPMHGIGASGLAKVEGETSGVGAVAVQRRNVVGREHPRDSHPGTDIRRPPEPTCGAVLVAKPEPPLAGAAGASLGPRGAGEPFPWLGSG